jgi:hypothetical protein
VPRDALPRLTAEQRLQIFRRVCDVVGRIHRAGVVHLDLKPRNIVLRSSDDPVVTDFGVAVELDQDGTARSPGHTREFAAPEQLAGERVDRRADIHALGVTLERMVVSPSAHVRRVVARARSERREDRYADAAALLADLDRPVRRRRMLVRGSTVGVAGLAVAGVAVFFALPGGPAAQMTTLDFDGIEAYARPLHMVDARDYLAASGVTVSAMTPGTGVVVAHTHAFYAGAAAFPVSAPNVLSHVPAPETSPVPYPITFTLTFQRPVVLVQFRRVPLIAATKDGILTPAWSAVALDARGNEVFRDGEPMWPMFAQTPSRPFALTGACIAAVRFDSNYKKKAAFHAVVIDDLSFIYAADGDC